MVLRAPRPRCLRRVAQAAGPVDAFTGRRVITIVITAARCTSGAVVDTEGRLLSTARVIGWITDHAGRIDTLLAITIAIDATGDARAAVGGTERRVAAAT